jgi:hypothetical protein
MPRSARELPTTVKRNELIGAYSDRKETAQHKTTMPASVASAPVHRTVAKTPASRAKKPAGKAPQVNGAMNGANHLTPYEIMASRIMNRVGEMAENISFYEREK